MSMVVVTVRYRFFSDYLRRQFMKRECNEFGRTLYAYEEPPDGIDPGVTRVHFQFNTLGEARAFHKPYEDGNPAGVYGQTLNSWGSGEEGDVMSIRSDMKREHEESERQRQLLERDHLDITGMTFNVACGGGLASDPILMDADGRVLTHDKEAHERIAALEARVAALEAAAGCPAPVVGKPVTAVEMRVYGYFTVAVSEVINPFVVKLANYDEAEFGYDPRLEVNFSWRHATPEEEANYAKESKQ